MITRRRRKAEIRRISVWSILNPSRYKMETLVVALTFHRKLVSFLASLPVPNSLSSASPGDIQKFQLGRLERQVRPNKSPSYVLSTSDKPRSLFWSCFARLSSGTVDSLLGKLRVIFAEAGLGGEWDDWLGIGNPVSHPSIKNYLKLIKQEQAKARDCPVRVCFLESFDW